MYYALEEGKIVFGPADMPAVQQFANQRLLSNPKIGASIRVLKDVGGFVSEKIVSVQDDAGSPDANEADRSDAGSLSPERGEASPV